MPSARIRPIAIGLFRHEGRLLVSEGADPATGEVFYRPLGGGIEFGEPGAAALARELREEIGAEVVAPRFRGTIENLFRYNGAVGHEIVLVFEGRLADSALYETDALPGQEDDGSDLTVLWKPIADFTSGRARLVPAGLLDYLTP
jgi:8-oxo-dGTP pyrophosphatase MutT (NUDIX family)